MHIQELVDLRLYSLEALKLRNRRLSQSLLIFYFIALPLLVNLGAHYGRSGPEGTYVEEMALAFLSFSSLYLFFPLWVILLVASEFKNGYVHRVVFLSSRDHYFRSKMAFCTISSIIFSIIGVVTLAGADVFSPYPFLEIPLIFYFKYFFQCLLTFLALSLFLVSLIFIMRGIVVTFVAFFAWQLLEGTIYLVAQKYGYNLVYMPLHLLRGLFVHDGEPQLGNYFMLFDQWKWTYIWVALLVVVSLTAAYRYFVQSSLFTLSD